MTKALTPNSRLLDFWNNRSQLDYLAGTNDFVAKEIEMQVLSKYFSDGQKVLEVGCGNGIAAIEFSKKFSIDITAIDFAPGMIQAAEEKMKSQEKLRGTVQFRVGDIRDMPDLPQDYDIAYTERVLINLPNWEEQAKAIESILSKLRPGGTYLMCENSADGLEKINEFREAAGLVPISAPWHNRYLVEGEVANLSITGAKLVEVIPFSATYYFISRVVNAWLAGRENKEPAYDAIVNQLALLLPSIGDFGQGKLWVWEKLS